MSLGYNSQTLSTDKLAEYLTVEDKLEEAEQQSAQKKQCWDMLRHNDPTEIDLQQWQEHDARLNNAIEQAEQAIHVLHDRQEDARCPACMQLFVEHTPEYRIQHLKMLLQESYPKCRSELKQQKETLDQRKQQWKKDQHEAEKQYEEKLWTLMDDFKRHFYAANTQEVAHRTAELLRDAITDQSILGIQFEAKGLFYLDGSSIVRSVQRLSGGEKALVGLCLRLALAEQAQTISRIGKVKFLILDEVLASLDEERCEAVQRIFQNVLQRGIFEQIIMVTHLESVKQSWQTHELTIQKVNSTTSMVIGSASSHAYDEVLEELEV